MYSNWKHEFEHLDPHRTQTLMSLGVFPYSEISHFLHSLNYMIFSRNYAKGLITITSNLYSMRWEWEQAVISHDRSKNFDNNSLYNKLSENVTFCMVKTRLILFLRCWVMRIMRIYEVLKWRVTLSYIN